MTRIQITSFSLLAFLFATSCEQHPAPSSLPSPEPTKSSKVEATLPSTSVKNTSTPTLEEAKAFFAKVDADLRRLSTEEQRAGWVNQTYITEDTDALAASASEASMRYIREAIVEAKKFENLKLPDDMARQLYLLKTTPSIPAPSDPREQSELAGLTVAMTSAYGKAKYCPKSAQKIETTKTEATKAEEGKNKCSSLEELSNTIATKRSYDELAEAWTGWHDTGKGIRDKYTRYVELSNKGARDIGFADTGALWRAGYDMSDAEFAADVERLWEQVRPFYEELHCYVRSQLRTKYGKEKIGEKAPIPAHLLGNMWAQAWSHIYDLVEPYAGQSSLDVTKALKDKKYDEKGVVKLGESFFTSLGFDPLPKTFWERSLFKRPEGRDVVCHASAWDITFNDDLRIKMCIEIKEEDLIVVHHELGHNYYFHSYYKLPILHQRGANDGFHEGIGDTLALSVTPAYLSKIGLLNEAPENPKSSINYLMKMALDRVGFLPFGKVIDQWRWDVFSGKISPKDYNKSWWQMRLKYQGIAPPSSRSDDEFDAGAKFHVPSSTPYIRYFLAHIYQFQFHKALCKAAGHEGPLHKCSIYGNKNAGAKLKAMLEMGASKPWPEALKALSGETKADASVILEYFAPLREWLREHNKGQTCGW